MLKILIINGPNLDMLGQREENIYGKVSIKDINEGLSVMVSSRPVQLEFFQSNHEGDIVDAINGSVADGIIINPAAYTHTSVAIRDAVSAKEIPVIEVHLSNIYSREEFRHKSLIAPVATGQISGLGEQGYYLALEALLGILNEEK